MESVRLIDQDGTQRGIMATREALALARSLDLDLVEIAPTASPPVCRIMDYGKFKFDEAQKAKESRRKSTNVGIKEMKYRPKIGAGDFETKTRLVEKFLGEGAKVEAAAKLDGRNMTMVLGPERRAKTKNETTRPASVEAAASPEGQ